MFSFPFQNRKAGCAVALMGNSRDRLLGVCYVHATAGEQRDCAQSQRIDLRFVTGIDQVGAL
jgi:hypothetical protein